MTLPAGSGGIRNQSVAFCEEITTIDRDFLVRGPLGRPVGVGLLDVVVRAVRRALGDVLPA